MMGNRQRRIGGERADRGSARGFALRCHPDTPPLAVRAVSARLRWTGSILRAAFTVGGAERLTVPPPTPPRRADGLWRGTCFELFLKGGDGRYFEFNLSPSGQWAGYAFDGYRSGMRAFDPAFAPVIAAAARPGAFVLRAEIDTGAIPPGGHALAVSAVIEEAGGIISYWALAHPPGAPDFHHPACFAATVAAPPRA